MQRRSSAGAAPRSPLPVASNANLAAATPRSAARSVASIRSSQFRPAALHSVQALAPAARQGPDECHLTAIAQTNADCSSCRFNGSFSADRTWLRDCDVREAASHGSGNQSFSIEYRNRRAFSQSRPTVRTVTPRHSAISLSGQARRSSASRPRSPDVDPLAPASSGHRAQTAPRRPLVRLSDGASAIAVLSVTIKLPAAAALGVGLPDQIDNHRPHHFRRIGQGSDCGR